MNAMNATQSYRGEVRYRRIIDLRGSAKLVDISLLRSHVESEEYVSNDDKQ